MNCILVLTQLLAVPLSESHCDMCSTIDKRQLKSSDRATCCGEERCILEALDDDAFHKIDLGGLEGPQARAIYRFFSRHLGLDERTPLPACVVSFARRFASGGPVKGFQLRRS